MLVGEIVRDPYSHLAAEINGWAYVPAPTDVLFYNWVDAQAQMHHRPGKVAPQPVARPWTVKNERRDVMPDPGRSERRRALMARLGKATVDVPVGGDGEDQAFGLAVQGAVDDVDQP